MGQWTFIGDSPTYYRSSEQSSWLSLAQAEETRESPWFPAAQHRAPAKAGEFIELRARTEIGPLRPSKAFGSGEVPLAPEVREMP